MSSLPKSDPTTPRDDLVERGQTAYRRTLASVLEPSHDGEFVAVEPDSGQYFLGNTASAAPVAAHAAIPKQTFLPHARWSRDRAHRRRTCHKNPVNAHREPVVKIRFVQGNIFECVVDTGFDGALILPRSIAKQLGLTVVARLVFELVGGARMTADVALAEMEWLDDSRRVEVILSEGNDALLGTEMCEGAILVIDYPNRSVLIS